MKRKMWIALCCAFLVAGCASTLPVRSIPPQEVKITVSSTDPVKVDVNTEDKISRAMEVSNPEGQLSGLSFRCGDVGYIKIFAGISYSDTGNIWNDLIVFRAMGIKRLHVFINSPGGDAFQGLAISDHLVRAQAWFAEIEGHANGMVMSAAVPILASCTKRYASSGTVFMIHKESIWKWPSSETIDDLEAQTEMLKMIRSRYVSRLPQEKISDGEWENKIKATTYFGVEEALEWGLIHGVE